MNARSGVTGVGKGHHRRATRKPAAQAKLACGVAETDLTECQLSAARVIRFLALRTGREAAHQQNAILSRQPNHGAPGRVVANDRTIPE